MHSRGSAGTSTSIRIFHRLNFIVLCALSPGLVVHGQTHLQGLQQTAEKLFEQGHDEEARAEFRDLLTEVHRKRAGLYHKEGRWDDVRVELESAWDLNRDAPGLQADLAHARFRTGDHHGAIELLAPIASASPERADIRGLLGRAYFSSGSLDSARRELEASTRLDPSDSATSYTLALVLLSQNDLEGAERIFTGLERQRGSTATFQMLVGRAYLDAGFQTHAQRRLRRALALDGKIQFGHYLLALSLLREKVMAALGEGQRELAQELALYPNEFAARYLAALLEEEQSRWNSAETAFRRATQLAPGEPDPLFHLGCVEIKLGRLSQAIQHLGRALDLLAHGHEARFEPSRAHYLLSQTYRALGKFEASRQEMEAARRTSSSVVEAERERTGSNLAKPLQGIAPAQAVEWLDSSRPSPLNSEDREQLARYGEILARGYNDLALITARRSDFAEAAQYFDRALQLKPGLPELECNLGIALYRAGRFSGAGEHLERALRRDASNLRVKEYLGLSYSEVGEYSKAVPLLEEVRRSRPDDEQVLLGLANALTQSDRPDEAQRVIEDLLKSHPDSAPLHVLWGKAYGSQGNPEEARHEFERALQIDPKVPDAHFYLGVMSFQQGKLEEAAQQFQNELVSHPYDARSRYHLAATLLLERRLDEGITLLRQVIQARPDYAAAHYSLGKTLLEQAKVDEAARELETAVKLEPGAAYAHYQLGRAYLLGGRKQDAEHEFQVTQNLKKTPTASRDSVPP